LLLAALTLSAHAHGELDRQIAAVTDRIRRAPKDATLLLQRAELYRQHAEPEAALADLAQARQLAPQLVEVDFTEGRVLLDTGRLAEARSALDRFLKAQPDHPIALWYRAQTLVKLDQRRLADTDLKRCLEVAPEPTPELFIARAVNLEKLGDLEPALAVVEAGIQRLGAISSLNLAAVEFEVKLQRLDAALARLDQLIAGSARKEALLLRKGNLLAQSGQIAAARECFLAARTELEALPPTTRKTRNNRALAGEIEKALERLEANPILPAEGSR
jgi:tetratricopeptide (TPR) repeat protein